MLQFSLRNLLAAVAAVAVGTAALLNANAWWSALLWGAVLSMLLLAVLMVLCQAESKRAFWSGYLVAGSLYLLLLMYSVPSNNSNPYVPLNHYHLITTRVIVLAYSLFPTSKTTQFLPSPPVPGGGIGGAPGMGGMAGSSTPNMSYGSMPGGMGMAPGMGGMGAPMTPNPNYIEYETFIEIGQALWMLLISWLGGTVAFWIYRTRDKATVAASSNRVANG